MSQSFPGSTDPLPVPRFTTYRSVVQRVREIGPNYVRVTLGGPELRDYECSGLAPKVKVFIPTDPASESPVPALGPSGFEYPVGTPTAVARTYTVRAHRRNAGEVDIDFVVHAAGPGGRWAAGASEGDVITITNGSGSSLPQGVGTMLLVGDPSSLPAIMTIVESAGTAISFSILLLADSAADIVPLEPLAAGRSGWLLASGSPGPGAVLAQRVVDYVRAEDVDYVWVAGEAYTIRDVRRVLRDIAGFTKANSRVVGYWKKASTADEYDRQTLDRMRSAHLLDRDSNTHDLDELSVPDEAEEDMSATKQQR
ncbi:siderophore-interacting protein [Rhodococcus sp. ACT016]|uniref:siderophore-interacting protein n=1 Tax=Rhodococcus sp. ACT016 TaxID=3134808 RepID=UPI003D27E5C8